METVMQVKNKVTLLLISAILVLCVGFFIVSCGSGISPQMKVLGINGGPYAVDFSDCPIDPCRTVIKSDVFASVPSKHMAGKELTVEAWVKIHSTSTSGTFFGRIDSSGIAVYSESGTPKAVVRRVIGAPGSTSTVDLIVSAPSDLTPNEWTHLAGVLSFPNDSTDLDLFVNGIQVASSSTSTASTLYTEPGGDLMFAGLFGEGFSLAGASESLDGAVDEARLWGVARTISEIQACMGEELGLNSGICGRITDDLIGYFRFNEGTGYNVSEWSGLGGGFNEYTDPASSNDPPVEHWNTGWTSGAPILARD